MTKFTLDDSTDPEIKPVLRGEVDSSTRALLNNDLYLLYGRISHILNNAPPININELVHLDLLSIHKAVMTERDWRMLRFAIEFTRDTLCGGRPASETTEDDHAAQ